MTNFGFAPRKISVKAQCVGCKNNTIQSLSKTLAAKHSTPIPIAAGIEIGKCPICHDTIKTVEQEVTPLANGQYRIYTAEEKTADEQAQVAAEQAQIDRDRGKLCIEFGRLLISSQVINSTNEHMHGTLSFRAWPGEDVKRQQAKAFVSIVNQPSGENNSYNEMPLVVKLPEILEGQINFVQFRDAAEEYIKQQVGVEGSGMNIGSTVVLKGGTFGGNGPQKIYAVEVINSQVGPW